MLRPVHKISLSLSSLSGDEGICRRKKKVATESIYSQCIRCSVSQSNIQSARQSSQALNQLSHTCELNTRKIIHHTEISILAVWWAQACQTSSTWWYFTPTSSAAHQRLWKEAASHPELEQTNAPKLTADNAEGSFLSGRNPFHPALVGQLSLRAVQQELCQQVWTRVRKLLKPGRSPGVHLGGSSRCLCR